MKELVAALIVFALVASLRFLSLTGFPDDHYVHLAGAQQMLRGEWPSRDFVDLGAPLTYAISAAAQALLGERQLTEALLMAFAFGLGAVLTLRAGVLLTGSVILGLAAALIELLVYPRTYSYPKIVLYAAAAVAFLWYANRPSRARLMGLAALAAGAALVRHDHGLYIGIASAAAVALSPLPSDRFKGGISVATLAVAAFVFMLPYFIYLQTAADGVVAHLRRAAAFAALEVPRQGLSTFGLPSYGAWLVAAVWLAPVVALAVLAVPLLRRREGAWELTRRVAPIIVLAVVANAGLIRDRLDVRLPDAIVAPALLMVWLVYQAWRMPLRPVGVVTRVVAVAALLVTMRYAAVMGSIEEQLDRANVLAGFDRVPAHLVSLVRDMDRPWAGRLAPSAVARELRPFFDYVPRCIPSHQRLLVAAWLPEIAVLSQRAFAGGQIWFMPGALKTPADHALVMRRLGDEDVPVAVYRRPAYDELGLEFPELHSYITGRFTEVASWSLGGSDEVHLLMATKDATGTDRKTGWPCFR